MKATTVRMTDNFDALKGGEIYEVCGRAKSGNRLVVFTNIRTGHVVSLYAWQVTQARTAGKMIDYDDTASAQMQGSIASSVCASLPTKFIY